MKNSIQILKYFEDLILSIPSLVSVRISMKLTIWFFEQLTKVTDTSAVQARRGKDIQGIPWERLNISREKYRLTRLEQYKNYENIPASGENTDKVHIIAAKWLSSVHFCIFFYNNVVYSFQKYKPVEKGANYYEFFYNTRVVKPTILHFQVCGSLRNRDIIFSIVLPLLMYWLLCVYTFKAKEFGLVYFKTWCLSNVQ